jgi:soluble P-type ATPase
MLNISIPGASALKLDHLVLDFNGTIALDGRLIETARERIDRLSSMLDIHIVTADTHGSVKQQTKNVNCSVHIIGQNNQDQEKKCFVEQLGRKSTVAIGNGRNDSLMLNHAVLGIGIIQSEGGSAEMIRQADVICNRIEDGLDLLLKPERLQATLRN